ncbi:NUDIX hydrolase [Antrihabitans cavernicola]|nr:NUDIX hydrolase [Spelaeibacter cavernicola]
MLLRDGTAGVEVFLQRRVGGMEFAGGMTVFPGGRVDLTDADSAIEWAGPPVSWWAERFATDDARAVASVCAAVRETFEECGVLLAGPTSDTVVADTSDYREARTQLENHELTFANFLASEKLVLRADLLRPWANWITPVGEKRRYDTRFFAAVVPHGQIADGATSEADTVVWQTPADALAQWKSGGNVLLPPTWTQLTSLSGFATTADVLAAEPEITTILPLMHKVDGTLRIDFPDDEGYYEAGPHPWA